jgi:hypothetical protein
MSVTFLFLQRQKYYYLEDYKQMINMKVNVN